MILKNLKILTDENIPAAIVTFLRKENFDVFDIKEEGLMGSDDKTILTIAVSEQRVILTQDSDFGTLAIVKGQVFLGIIYLKPGHILPKFTIETLETLFSTFTQSFEYPFILVAKHQEDKVKIRFRQY